MHTLATAMHTRVSLDPRFGDNYTSHSDGRSLIPPTYQRLTYLSWNSLDFWTSKHILPVPRGILVESYAHNSRSLECCVVI